MDLIAIGHRYDVIRSLGQGGLGEVLEVVDRLDGRTLALKRVHSPDDNARLRHEYALLARLAHPGLPEVFRFGVDSEDGRAHFAMELVRGERWHDVFEGRQAARGDEAVVDLLSQLCRVLGHLHDHGLCHGDVSPANVMLAGPSGSAVKLLDLGLSDGDGPGSLAFAAPERLRGGAPTPASDWFGFALLAAIALSGRHPFPQYPKAMPKEGFRLEFSSGLGRALHSLLARLLAPDPAARDLRAGHILASMAAATGYPIEHVTVAELRVRCAAVQWVAPSAEWEGLDHHVDTWLDGTGSEAIWVQGGWGTGRSRCLADWAARLEQRNTRVLRFRCRPTDVGLELALGLLDASLRDAPALELQAFPALARDLLERRRGGATGVVPTDIDPRRERAQRVDAIAQTFLLASKDRPTAILIDDADLADAESRAVIEVVCRFIASREAESGVACPDSRLFLALAGASPWLPDGLGRCIPLSPWQSEALEVYLQRVFPRRRIDADLVRALLGITGGVPVLVVQTVQDLFERAQLAVGEHHVALCPECERVAGSGLQASVGLWLAAKVDGLPPELHSVLAALALLDADVPAAWVASLLDRGHDDVRAELTELVGRGLAVLVESERSVRYGLPAPLERQVASAYFLPSERKKFHLDSACFFSDLDDPRALDYRAFHLASSLDVLEAASGAVVCEAARQDMARGEYPQALRLVDVARRCVWGDGDWARELCIVEGQCALALGAFERAASAFEEAAARSHRDEGRAEAEAWAGLVGLRRGEFDRATTLLLSACALLDRAEAGVVTTAQAHAWLAQAHLFSGEYGEAIRVSEAALERLEASACEDEDQVHVIRGRLAQVLGLAAFYRGELEEALRCLLRAREEFEDGESLVDVANADSNAALVYHRRDEYDRALELYEKALAVYQMQGDRARQWATLMNMGVVYQEQGDYGRALESYERSLHLATAIGDRGGVIRNSNNLGNALRVIGDVERARLYVAESLRLARETGDRFIQGYNLALLGELARLEGARETAAERLGEAESLFSELGCANEGVEVAIELAHLKLDAGELDGAREGALAAGRAARERGVRDLLARALTIAAEAERRMPEGDVEAAMARLGEAEAIARELGNREVLWPTLVAQARLARDKSDLADACRFGLEALDVLRALVDRLPVHLRPFYEGSAPRREAFAELRWVDALARFDASSQARSTKSPTLVKLLEINKRLSSEHDLMRLLEFIMDSAILLTGAERGFLLMREFEDRRDLQIKVARNFDRENIRNVKFKVSRSIAERVLEEAEPIVTVDAMEDERYREYLSIHSLRLRSIMCVPLRRGERSIGVLYLDNRFQVNAFDEEDLRFMEAFADQAAIAIGNAQLLEEKDRARQDLETSRAEVAALNRQLEEKLTATKLALDETRTRVERQQRQLEGRHRYANIVGQSAKLREVLYVVERVLDNVIPVLVMGESGTGKELVARAIHYNGARRDEEFVAINCGSIPATLFESELFGHVRGAFTGAATDKRGLFEVANKGTLLLDEIGELPLEMQVKLLRVLQSGEIQKVGSPRTQRVDVRIIAATNRDLREEVRARRFREDLYYRLNVVQVVLPPLRERPEDVPLLVQHFIRTNREAGLTNVTSVSAEALALLARYHWPGNIRELDTAVKNASVFAEGDVLQVRDFAHIPELMDATAGKRSLAARSTAADNLPVGVTLAELERDAIVRTLEALGGNKKRAAEVLGIDRRTLYNKLAVYEIELERQAKVLDRT